MRSSTTYAGYVRRFGLLITAVPLAACLAEEPGPLDVQDPDARALLQAVEAEGYPDWEPPPTSADLPRRRVATGPHGAWVEVYLHPDLLEAFLSEEPLGAWPDGVAAVCESYDGQEAPDPFLINVMRKDAQGWSWAQLDAMDRVLTDPRPDDCIGCHGAADDFVFSLFLREE